MVRKTSKEAFDKIREGGLLTARRFEVYEWLYRHGPATAQEVERDFLMDLRSQGRHVNKRLPELREQGVVEERGERECRVTGRNAILWDVTDLATPRPVRPNGRRRQKELLLMDACNSCSFVIEDESHQDLCWLDPEVELWVEGQPPNCPLISKDYVVRSPRAAV